jgi:hypothetical protein
MLGVTLVVTTLCALYFGRGRRSSSPSRRRSVRRSSLALDSIVQREISPTCALPPSRL